MEFIPLIFFLIAATVISITKHKQTQNDAPVRKAPQAFDEKDFDAWEREDDEECKAWDKEFEEDFDAWEREDDEECKAWDKEFDEDFDAWDREDNEDFDSWSKEEEQRMSRPQKRRIRFKASNDRRKKHAARRASATYSAEATPQSFVQMAANPTAQPTVQPAPSAPRAENRVSAYTPVCKDRPEVSSAPVKRKSRRKVTLNSIDKAREAFIYSEIFNKKY